jgi:hypothetical protein
MRALTHLSLTGSLAAALVAFVGCSDYDLKRNNDAEGADTDGADTGRPGDGPPGVSACDAASDPGTQSVDINDECEVELQTGSFTPVVEWSYGTSAFCGPPAVGQIADTNGSGDIDSDDLPIILMYQNSKVVALYGDGSGVLWQTSSNYGQDGGFAIGDIDGDGWPDVVTASNNSVCALEGETGAQKWCASGLSSSLDAYGYSYPAIADMDGDGLIEVTAGDAILHGQTGALLGRGGLGIGAARYSTGTGYYGAISVPVDLDGDGEMELVTGNAAYTIDGALVWANGGWDGLVAVADFDGDGQGEIVKTTDGGIIGMESDGTEVWGPVDFAGSGVNAYAALGTPAIDDLDGDGTPEITFAAKDELIAMEWGGSIMWRATISDSSGAAGPVLFDFEMDGYPEVLYADEGSIRFFSGLDGAAKYFSAEHESYTILETPIVADVDGDDQVEIVLGHCGTGGPSSYGGLTVFGDADESWPPGRKVWNQHAYHITNIDDLGTVPPPQNNWDLYNNFRSGDIGRPPSEFWDLRPEILDVCEDECDAGVVYVAARVNNAGNIDVPAGVQVTLRAGPGGAVLDTQTTTEVIPAATTGELLVFEADSGALGGYEPVVTADEDSRGNNYLFECDESNNTDTWLDAVCD